MGEGEEGTLAVGGTPAAPVAVGAVETALMRIGVREHVARLLAATPSLRPSWFAAVALAAGLSVAASNAQTRGLPVFLFLAPLLPIAGVAAAYGPGVDPAYEISRAAPTSSFTLTLWRAAAVLATTTVLTFAAGFGLSAEPWTAAAWVLPSFAVAVASIALGTILEPAAACATVASVWIAGSIVAARMLDADSVFRGPAQLAYAALAIAGSVVVVRRRERVEIDQRRVRRRIVVAADEERRRLERNLHDGAQQQLVGIALKVRLAKAQVHRDQDATATLLDELETDVADALASLRELARGMYPPILAERGLVAALEAHASRLAFSVDVHAPGLARYAAEIEATLYFCCLEALQNVSKYAGASRVTVRLDRLGDELGFAVTDDGAGFEPRKSSRGAGLRNMEERLRAYGGSVEVRSAPGRGTTVRGRLKLDA